MGTTASRISFGTASPQAPAASSAVASTSSMSSGEGWASIRQRRPNPMCQRSSLLDALDALEHPGQRAVLQVREQRALPGQEDDPLEDHVVEADARVDAGAARRELARHRGQPLLEELEHAGRGVLTGRVETLVRGVAGELEHLGGDAVEHHRVALLVAALQVEDPGHQGVVGRLSERRDVLGDGVLRHAEAGEERGQAIAALVRELGPRAGVGGEVDGLRIPLQTGHEPREEVGPLARREQVAGPDLLLGETKPRRGIEREVPRLPISHGGTIPSAVSGESASVV